MTTCEEVEQRTDEVEALLSIYDGDENFKQVDGITYQYKYTEDGKTFIVEVIWGTHYPTEKPKINLDIFYNQHLLPAVKAKILAEADKEAEHWLGTAMTYTIFERIRDILTDLLKDQTPEVVKKIEKKEVPGRSEQPSVKKVDNKKQPLTKAQKRRAWDRAEQGRGGEKPRGWDWVDIVKHLSQLPNQSA